MADQRAGPASLADQRYYHFVVFRSGGLSLRALWGLLGNTRESKQQVPHLDAGNVLEHRKLRLLEPFARGSVALSLSANGDGKPPYFYDIFCGRFDLGGEGYLYFGVPFSALSRRLTDDLIEARKPRKTEFAVADVEGLVAEHESSIVGPTEGLLLSVIGVECSVTEDKSLTEVRLGGEAPLRAPIYREYLRSRLGVGVRPDSCLFKCELDLMPHGAVRSRLMADRHGNYRFYAHVGCANIGLLPNAIRRIGKTRRFRKSETNPLHFDRGERD